MIDWQRPLLAQAGVDAPEGQSAAPDSGAPAESSTLQTDPADAAGNANASGSGARPGSFLQSPLMLFMLMFLMMYVFVFMGRGKKQKKFDQMLSNLKKNDRVVTIGGIMGTVVSTRGEEVVVKVDESSNTKMTFVRKAIQRVVTEEDQAATS